MSNIIPIKTHKNMKNLKYFTYYRILRQSSFINFKEMSEIFEFRGFKIREFEIMEHYIDPRFIIIEISYLENNEFKCYEVHINNNATKENLLFIEKIRKDIYKYYPRTPRFNFNPRLEYVLKID